MLLLPDDIRIRLGVDIITTGFIKRSTGIEDKAILPMTAIFIGKGCAIAFASIPVEFVVCVLDSVLPSALLWFWLM